MMKDISSVPASNIARLPRYYRFLSDLQEKEVMRISSNELAEIMGVTASQIRQDFSCFGLTGQQGYGYSVEQVRAEIAQLLGLESVKPSILVGVGNLGRAVATLTFADKGFRLIAAFDQDPGDSARTVAGLTVQPTTKLSEFCSQYTPECAFLCLPEDKAPEAVRQLIELGVKSFWNFSHYDIKKDYPEAIVENVHLSDSLMRLSYTLATSKR